jgi:hypothetical protein
MRRSALSVGFLLSGSLMAACTDSAPSRTITAPATASLAEAPGASTDGAAYSPMLDELRQSLRAAHPAGIELASAKISVFGDSAGWTGVTTLIANNRTHVVDAQFVAGDERRHEGSDITYVVDQSDGQPLSRNPTTGAVFTLENSVTEPAIDASMLTWQNSPACISVPVTKLADNGGNIDLIDDLVLGGPVGTPTADITHGGWLAPLFFNRIAANGSTFILGITFTFVFIDDDGNPTDVDHDGRADVAFREIYYNRGFAWSTVDGTRNVDIQSVVTHEAGHAFGLDHFGKVFIDNRGVIKYAPRAIMNAVYVSPFRELTGTDNSSFCQLWAASK